MGNDSFIFIGPAGEKNKDSWDEMGHDQIVQIFISHGDNSGIDSIQFQYVKNGVRKMSESHGYSCAPKFDVVELKYPVEFITWISGYLYNGCLASLTIGTNCGQYGPFGRSKNLSEYFRFELGGNRQFGGFHGHGYGSVRSIRVYLKPTTRELPVVKHEQKSI